MVRSNTILLDTGILVRLAKDWGSRLSRDKATRFISNLYDSGYVPLLTIEHLNEVFQHQNPAECEVRFEFLCSLPKVAYVPSRHSSLRPGGYIDIVGREIAHCTENGSSSFSDTLTSTRHNWFSAVDGRSLLNHNLPMIQQFHLEGEWSSYESKRIASISHVDCAGMRDMTIGECRTAQLNSDEERTEAMHRLGRRLSGLLETQGDTRLQDPHGVAYDFFSEVSKDLACQWPEGATVDDYIRSQEETGTGDLVLFLA